MRFEAGFHECRWFEVVAGMNYCREVPGRWWEGWWVGCDWVAVGMRVGAEACQARDKGWNVAHACGQSHLSDAIDALHDRRCRFR